MKLIFVFAFIIFSINSSFTLDCNFEKLKKGIDPKKNVRLFCNIMQDLPLKRKYSVKKFFRAVGSWLVSKEPTDKEKCRKGMIDYFKQISEFESTITPVKT